MGEERGAPRRHDLDWLRVFATYLLFVFHVTMVFNPAPFYHVRNVDTSFFMLVLAGFIGLWHMPLFFLLAGWSIFSSLEKRGGLGFTKERVLRLWIPLVMACVLLMPPIKYLELKSGLDANYTGLYVAPRLQLSFVQVIPSGLPAMAPFDESFLEFLPTFFTRPERFTWAHMWFVAYLLTFTLLYLPLFSLFRRTRARFEHAGALCAYAPILPLATIQITMRERWPGLQNLYDDWANFAYYSTYLIAGFLLARLPSIEQAVHREWRRALAIGLGATLVLLLAVLGVVRWAPALLAGSAVAGWCFVVALLGFAHERLSFSNPALQYLVESAFPIYILHQSAIVLIGYPLVQLPMGIAAKYGLLLPASVGAAVAVYHFGVRPFSVSRFLFGMKARTPSAGPIAVRYQAAATLLLIVGGLSFAVPSLAASPLGAWYAEGGAAKVEMRACGAELCGRVTWLRSPFDENGCELTDRHNGDPAQRSRPVVGLEIIRGLERSPADDALWTGGTIYDPTTGRSYSCTLRMEGGDRLRIRGYLGISLLGRSTTWLRVGAENRVCRR